MHSSYSVLLLVLGYLLILGISWLLIRNWLIVPHDQRGSRFILLRRLNIAIIVLSCIALACLITAWFISGHSSIAGYPLIALLLGISASPKRFAPPKKNGEQAD